MKRKGWVVLCMGCDSFLLECERCGKLVPYEDMECLCESYLCKNCYEFVIHRVDGVILEEDDGYPD